MVVHAIEQAVRWATLTQLWEDALAKQPPLIKCGGRPVQLSCVGHAARRAARAWRRDRPDSARGRSRADRLHRTPLDLIELQPLIRQRVRRRQRQRYIHPLLPEVGANARRLDRTRCTRAAAEAPSFAYGDFKADLWITPGGLTLIDFDTCYLFDPRRSAKFTDILFWRWLACRANRPRRSSWPAMMLTPCRPGC
jgi:hypothetical protein